MPSHERLITKDNLFSHFSLKKRPWQEDYLAMYTSQWHGYVTDPALMMVPVDDHMVHRGDGVFDVMRCINGRIYQMEAHLRRLERSARAIDLELPPEYSDIREIIQSLVLTGGEKECLIRVFLSRGPGGFSANPFECPASQMYIIVIRYHELPGEYYIEGIPVVISEVPIKKSFFATVKSCNYLPNVLVKMGAVRAGCQYAVVLDDDGFLAEGATENICILSMDGVLKFPGFEKILAGITAERIFELANVAVTEEIIKGVCFDKISVEEACRSSEIMLMGTSINIVPVVSFDGKPIGHGRPGPLYSKLSDLLGRDMKENPKLLTKIEWGENQHE